MPGKFKVHGQEKVANNLNIYALLSSQFLGQTSGAVLGGFRGFRKLVKKASLPHIYSPAVATLSL